MSRGKLLRDEPHETAGHSDAIPICVCFVYMLPAAYPNVGRLLGDRLRGEGCAEPLGVPPSELLSDATRTSAAESDSGISNLESRQGLSKQDH